MASSFGNNFYLIQSRTRGGAVPGAASTGITSPNDISGLTIWLDFTGLASNTTNSYGSVDGSGNITQVNNLKTGATDDFRAAASYWPALAVNGGPGGAKNAAFFDGSYPDKLVYHNSGSPATGSWAAPYTAIIICKKDIEDVYIIGLGLSTGNVYIPAFWADHYVYFSGGTNYIGGDTSRTGAVWNYIGVNATSATAGRTWFNGVEDTTTAGSESVSGNFDEFGILYSTGGGSMHPTSGHISEFIYYNNKSLDDTERTQLWNYITTKYGSSWPYA